MRVCEVFHSLQGEGPNAGRPAVFLRLTGCNLAEKCPLDCDTKYAWTEGSEMSVDEVFEKLNNKKAEDGIVITGGEPLLQKKELHFLLEKLPLQSFIDIETNGTIEPFTLFRSDMNYIVSPKREVHKNFLNKTENVFFKFVVRDMNDVKKVEEFANKFRIPKSKIFLMPEGKEFDKEKWRMVWMVCKEYGFRFTPRLQVLLYGRKRGV